MEEELNEAAYSYIQANKHNPEDKDAVPVIFAKLEFNADHEILFRHCGFTSVPILALAKPELAKTFAETGESKYPKELEWKLSTQDFFDAGKILEHINKITHNNVELKYTFMRIMMGNLLILTILGVLFFFKDTLGQLLQHKIVWMIISVVVFVMCIGGTAFNMIHKVPTFRYAYDQSGNMYVEEYIQRNQRSQYAGEGYMIAMLMLSIGTLMVAFTFVGHIKSAMRKEISCIIIIVGVFSLFSLLNTIFNMKASSYNPTFFPPDHYQAGPLMNDQGTIISEVN